MNWIIVILTLSEALDYYFRVEQMRCLCAGGNHVRNSPNCNIPMCEGCQAYTPKEKQTFLDIMPSRLIISLNIFQYDRRSMMLRKVTTNMQIPPILENVGQYLRTPANNETFALYGICAHHGQSATAGHYIAYCKNYADGNWRKFDDDRVSLLDNHNIEHRVRGDGFDPYILFYIRLDPNNHVPRQRLINNVTENQRSRSGITVTRMPNNNPIQKDAGIAKTKPNIIVSGIFYEFLILEPSFLNK